MSRPLFFSFDSISLLVLNRLLIAQALSDWDKVAKDTCKKKKIKSENCLVSNSNSVPVLMPSRKSYYIQLYSK